jgi:hypothetical protein
MTWLEWTVQLVGTLIGTGVGFGLAMWWDRKKERVREDSDRMKTAKSILLELQGISERLDTPEYKADNVASRPGAIAVEISIPFLSWSAFDAAVHSGKLTLLQPDLQNELATVYEQVRIMRLHVDNASTSYAHGDSVEDHHAVMSNAVNYMRAYGAGLVEQLHTACTRLDEEARCSNAA